MQLKFIISFILILISTAILADGSIVDENFLHPGDSFSAYTLNQKEVSWNIPVLPPSPGYLWFGITDNLTVELDLEANIGGVPSVNFRYRFLNNGKIALAVESMYQYVPRKLDFDYFEKGDGTDISVKRFGSSWYNHLNLSFRPFERLYFHSSLGAVYQKELIIKQRSSLNQNYFKDKINPDLSFGIDWRAFDSFAFLSSVSYGSTFIYLDNIPRKTQVAGGFRWAPFVKFDCAFINSFRLEAVWLYIRFHDIDKFITGPSGFIYWQYSF